MSSLEILIIFSIYVKTLDTLHQTMFNSGVVGDVSANETGFILEKIHKIHLLYCIWMQHHSSMLYRTWTSGSYNVCEIIHKGEVKSEMKTTETNQDCRVNKNKHKIYQK